MMKTPPEASGSRWSCAVLTEPVDDAHIPRSRWSCPVLTEPLENASNSRSRWSCNDLMETEVVPGASHWTRTSRSLLAHEAEHGHDLYKYMGLREQARLGIDVGDVAMKRCRLCNVFRDDDPASKLIQHSLESPCENFRHASAEDKPWILAAVLMHCALWRFFGTSSFIESFGWFVGFASREWDSASLPQRIQDAILHCHVAVGSHAFTGAYGPARFWASRGYNLPISKMVQAALDRLKPLWDCRLHVVQAADSSAPWRHFQKGRSEDGCRCSLFECTPADRLHLRYYICVFGIACEILQYVLRWGDDVICMATWESRRYRMIFRMFCLNLGFLAPAHWQLDCVPTI